MHSRSEVISRHSTYRSLPAAKAFAARMCGKRDNRPRRDVTVTEVVVMGLPVGKAGRIPLSTV